MRHSESTPPHSDSRIGLWLQARRLALPLCVSVVLVGYLLQSFTPIRLTPDVTTYLTMARNAAEGAGFQRSPEHTYYPIGYPAIVALLVKLRLGHPWALIILNVFWLIVASGAGWLLYRRAFALGKCASWLLTLAWPLSWVVIKSAAIPLTECSFLGATMSALVCMDIDCATWSPGQACRMGCLAALFSAAAVSFRTAGLALIPALFVMGFRFWRQSLKDRGWRFSALITVFAILAGLAIGLALMGIDSFGTYSRQAMNKPVPALGRALFRARELGGLALNLPFTIHARLLPGWVTVATGVVFGLLVLAGFCVRRRLSAVDLFALCYAGLVFQWPYFDERFFLPLVPLMSAYALVVVRSLNGRPWRAAISVYLTLFVCAGLFSLTYSVVLGTRRGLRFAESYGGGSLRNTYCVAFGDCAADPSLPPANAGDVEVLRFYR
jgi:hypothetical protein